MPLPSKPLIDFSVGVILTKQVLSQNSEWGKKNDQRNLRLRPLSHTCNIFKLSCHFPFTHAENTCILRTIDTYLQAVWANTRFFSSNQGKNAF